MAASWLNMIRLPNYKPCPKSLLPLTNVSSTRIRFNLKGELKTRLKTTSFARIKEEQDAEEEEEEEDQKLAVTKMVQPEPEQVILVMIKFLVELPVEFVLSTITQPGKYPSKASLGLLLAAVAVFTVLPGGASWEWWLAKSAVSAGLLLMAATLWFFACFGL